MFALRTVLSDEERKVAILQIASRIPAGQRAITYDVIQAIGAATLPERRKIARARASRTLTISTA